MKVNREWKSKGTDRPGRNRTRAAPRRSDIMTASSSSPSHPSGGDEGKSKGANRTRRDRTSAKDDADILASSSPLFRSVCCLTVRTIASGSPLRPLVSSLREMDGRPPRPLLGDVIATTSPANNRGSSPAGAVCHPAASRLRPFVPLFALISFARSCLTFCQPFCPPLPLCQVVMGRADHQPGQEIPSRSSCRPSPPCRGAVRTFRTDPGRGEGVVQPT